MSRGNFKGIASTTEFKSANQKDAFVVTNHTAELTEGTIVIPKGTTAFKLSVKTGDAVLEVSHTSGGPTFKINMGGVWEENGLNADNAVTIFIKANKAATPIQLLRWAEPT